MELYSELSNPDLFSFPAVRLNENCTDLDLGELCSADCSERVRSCLAFCTPGDVSCENSCIRQGFDCVDGCPCHADCFEGCDGCAADICNACFEPGENPDYKTCLNELELDLIQCLNDCSGSSTCVIQCNTDFLENFENCPCESGCPNGCPCPNYDCPSVNPTIPPQQLTSVLILDRTYPAHMPALANFEHYTEDISVSWYGNGPDNREFFFYEGCSVLYKGTNFLFGGRYSNDGGPTEYGPHILDGCDIVKAEGEEINHNCATGSVGFLPSEDDPEAYIMVYDGTIKVQTYDGSKFWDSQPTNRGHQYQGGQIASYEGSPILISGRDSMTGSYHPTVERFTNLYGWSVEESLVWPDGYTYQFTHVSDRDLGVILFPGYTSGQSGKIWRLFDDEWTHIGTATDGIYKQRAMARLVRLAPNELLIVGGSQEHNFEKYALNDDWTSIEGEKLVEEHPTLLNYNHPYAILVPDSYCIV